MSTIVPIAPAGSALMLTAGAARAEIVEVGGGLRSLVVAERPVLDGYAAGEGAGAGRGQILMPWPNRLGDGGYDFDATHFQLPVNDWPNRTAIHGLVRWLPWSLTRVDEARARAAVTLPPQPGWPTWLALSAGYVLAPDQLTITLAARNVGSVACPFGAGMHPYIRPMSGRVDGATLTVPSRRALALDERGLPAGWQDVTGTDADFRQPREIGAAHLDTCYAAGPGGWEVQVDGVVVWADGAFGHLQVFTGDTDPDLGRRRTALAVEPMTCPPDAFRTGEGLLRLEPGEGWSGSFGIRFPA